MAGLILNFKVYLNCAWKVKETNHDLNEIKLKQWFNILLQPKNKVSI